MGPDISFVEFKFCYSLCFDHQSKEWFYHVTPSMLCASSARVAHPTLLAQTNKLLRLPNYIATGVDKVKVTGDPDIVTQIVSGSLPICSVVKPCVLVTVPGTVTGMVVPQTLPLVVRVTPVIVFADGLVMRVSFGTQPSLAMRLAKAVEKSSCFMLMIGQLTKRIIS